ncbi:response regulator, partial [Vibrio parahaemolyticus]|nr:response regulator [Vibrio parahaemolyticus]
VKPQLVLLDVYLPDMQGTELVTYIRHHLHDTDIIMITAASETDVVRHALRGGVTDYIVKPLMFDRFKASLENYQKKLVQLKKNNKLSIEQIEHLWSQRGVKGNEIEYAPKGIDPLTLAKIKKHMLTVNEEGITAEVLSSMVGVSRSTARRYLEYLISGKKVHAERIYGSVGRPERRYFLIPS